MMKKVKRLNMLTDESKTVVAYQGFVKERAE